METILLWAAVAAVLASGVADYRTTDVAIEPDRLQEQTGIWIWAIKQGMFMPLRHAVTLLAAGVTLAVGTYAAPLIGAAVGLGISGAWGYIALRNWKRTWRA